MYIYIYIYIFEHVVSSLHGSMLLQYKSRRQQRLQTTWRSSINKVSLHNEYITIYRISYFELVLTRM